jgi:hypothetical protein
VTADEVLDDWLVKARYARALPAGELWPAWSTGEVLAVAIILDDMDRLEATGYTLPEALDRLRFDIGQASIEGAAMVFGTLRAELAREQTRAGDEHLPTPTQMLSRAHDELRQAAGHLDEAAGWARSDWRPFGSPLTSAQAEARSAVFAAVTEAKAAIERARRAIEDAAS